MEKKKKKRVIVISGAVLLVVLLAGFGVVCAGGIHRGFHPGFHGKGFHDKDVSDFMLWRLDKGVEELNFTEEQQEQYSVFKKRIETAFAEGKEIKTAIKEEIHSEFEKDNPDLELIAENAKAHMNELNSFMQDNIDLFKEFYGILDEEQKAMVIDKIKERMDHCGVS